MRSQRKLRQAVIALAFCELAPGQADDKLVEMRARESAAEYIVKNGKRKAVILPIEEYQELLEDLYDLGVIASRRHEPTVPFEDVLRRLKRNAAVSH